MHMTCIAMSLLMQVTQSGITFYFYWKPIPSPPSAGSRHVFPTLTDILILAHYNASPNPSTTPPPRVGQFGVLMSLETVFFMQILA
jgi:hypothetical protein